MKIENHNIYEYILIGGALDMDWKVSIITTTYNDADNLKRIVDQVKKQDYVSVDSLPKDRKLMSEDGYRGLYSSGKKFYTNKVKSGGLDIREWSKLSKAKEYLDNLK